MGSVKLQNVCKKYDDEVMAVENFNLDIHDGEFVVFVGPSGCGKSTTLRMIAGLESISEGELWINDQLANDLRPQDRDLAMVFQSYALYPHKTVFQNLAYPLKIQGLSKEEIDSKVKHTAKLIEIDDLLDRKPRQLSGGQRQRVALGRCLVRSPQAFLMDEPLSNLDAKLRVSMRSEIVNLQKKIQGTFIYVTHDQIEAMTMGDRIVVMNKGVIQQVGKPEEIYHHPKNRFVASFIGSPAMNFLYFDQSKITLNDLSWSIEQNGPFYLGVRPEHIVPARSEEDLYTFTAKIDHIEKLGAENYVNLIVNDQLILMRDYGLNPYHEGEVYSFSIVPSNIKYFDAHSEESFSI